MNITWFVKRRAAVKIIRSITILSIFLTVFVTPAVTKPVLAAKPKTHVQFEVPLSGTVVLTPGDPWDPCDIALTYTARGYLRINQWFDESGEILREMDIYGTVHQSISGSNGNSVNVQLYGPGFYTYDYSGNTVTVYAKSTGAQEKITIPGMGTVFGGAGNSTIAYVYDDTDPTNWIFLYSYIVRPNDYLDFSHWDIICSYLGGALE